MRIGGLASGMDTESIIKDMMRIEKMKVDKTFQEKTLKEWTRDAYNDINKKLADFILESKKSFGLTETSNNSLLNKSVNSLTWIKEATLKNADLADIKARSKAVKGDYEIKIHQLASNWSSASKEDISIKGADKTNIANQFGFKEGDTINFTIATNKGDININKTNLSEVSLKEIVNEINKADKGVVAIYDESIDRFFLQTMDTGSNQNIQITQNTEGTNIDFISKLRLQHEISSGAMEDVHINMTYEGKDALIDFGAAKNISKSSNQFTINDIDFDIKEVGETTLKVDINENEIVDKLKDFVEKYNELIDSLNGKTTEKRYRDFRPLTDEQKEAMKDKEIEIWEEKSKSGLLRNDSLLERTMQTIRTGLYENVQGSSGSFSHLTELGIQTEKYSSGSMGGKLEIDEEKLREALREDVDGVLEVLFKEPSKDLKDEKEKRANTGLISRIYGDIVTGMKDVIHKAGAGENASLYRKVNSTILLDFVTKHSSISMLDKDIMNYEKRTLDLERRMISKEEGYWKKFTAMEKALDKMYSQSNWLAQQLGGQ